MHLVSSYTHLPGHYWAWTCDLLRAMNHFAPGLDIQVHASRAPRERHVLADLEVPAKVQWKKCEPVIGRLAPVSFRGRHWDHKLENVIRFLEFKKCLESALKMAAREPGTPHIHCIESRHRLLLEAVLGCEFRFSALCVGNPPDGLDEGRKDLYRKAFKTGRLTFIVETEAVRKAWEELAGSQVVHIPAAIPFGGEKELSSKGRDELRRKFKLPRDKMICLFFGTHREGKDYETVVKAALLSKSRPFLLFAGPLISGNDPARIMKAMGYDPGTSLEGYFPSADVPDLFAASDFVMLPYADGYDKGSGVLLQACQHLRPIIATDTGLFADFIQKHQVGYLFPPQDAVGLRGILDEAASSRNERSASFHESLSSTREIYGWKTLSNHYLRLFSPGAVAEIPD